MGIALRVVTGLEQHRLRTLPAMGELLVTTDTRKAFVGDGTTPGGYALTSGCQVFETMADMLNANVSVGDLAIALDELNMFVSLALPATEIGNWLNLGNEVTIEEFQTLQQTVAGKADTTALNNLAETVSGKADASALDTLAETVSGKASQTALDTLAETVAGKADASALDTIQQALDGKLATSDFDALWKMKIMDFSQEVVILSNDDFVGNRVMKIATDAETNVVLVVPNGITNVNPLLIVRMGEGTVSITRSESVTFRHVNGGNTIMQDGGVLSVIPLKNDDYVLNGALSTTEVPVFPDMENGEFVGPTPLETLIGEDPA